MTPVLPLETLEEKTNEDKTIIPIETILASNNQSLKKKMIMSLLEQEIKQPGKYLHRALLDPDPEVVHYAATVQNSLQERYEKKLHELHQHANKSDKHFMIRLVEVYSEMINSGIISKQLKKEKLYEYKLELQTAIASFPDEPLFKYQLGLVHKELGDIKKAFEFFNTTIDEFTAYPMSYLSCIELLYRQERWFEISEYIRKFKKNVQKKDIPNKYLTTLSLLEGNAIENK